MKSLLEFKAWVERVGHYSALTAVNNYIRMKENERTKHTSKDNQEIGESRSRCNKLDNCE